MMLVRPVRLEDHTEMLALARLAGIGMTSLPPDSHVLKQKIERAVASFNRKPSLTSPPQAGGIMGGGDETFLFVLEDTETRKLIGSTGIIAHVGLNRPFYSYKISTIVQASAALEVYSMQKVLHMVNDYTGATEIGSLFLLPEYRRDGIGRFLSRSRYMMLAEFPQLFSDTVISEIRGCQDDNAESPFYNTFVKHFFNIDYKRADFTIATQGGQFIADLMPKYPIYVSLLHEKAREVLGVALEASRPAKGLLEKEGFAYQGYIDVLDAGPTLQAERAAIHTVRESKKRMVREIVPQVDRMPQMIANTSLGCFSIVYAPLQETAGDGVLITQEAAELLGVQVGDMVRYAL